MDSMVLALVAVIAAAALAMLLLVWRGGRGSGGGAAEQRLAQLEQGLLAAQNQLAGRLAALADSNAAAQSELNRTLAERLDAVSKRVGDSLELSAEKTGRSIHELQTRLVVIDEAQKHLSALSSQVIGLQDILDNKQSRGAFGEQILENLVQDALPDSVYEFQATLSTGNRVDCLLRLPNPPGSIPIDAKFPLESYRAMLQAGDAAEKKLAQRAFTVDMQKHIGDIASKYIVPGETAESALMFLPSEAIYGELHTHFQAIVEGAQRRRVWIVSPTTLMATLTTIRAVLKDARMREQAGVIQQQVALLAEDVARLDKRVENLKTHFAHAERDIKEIDVSTSKVLKRAGQIESLQIADGNGEADAALPVAGPPGADPSLPPK